MVNDWSIKQAVEVVRQGGVIAYPTEAVWGLGCNPWDEQAVKHLLAVKRRPMHKGLILVAASIEQVEPLLQNLTEEQRRVVEASWPGPNTWLIPDTEQMIPEWVKGKHRSVAVRVSAHPIVQALCSRADMPLVSTSANPSAAMPAKSKLRVSTYFGNRIHYRVQGSLGDSDRPSVIRDALTGQILRV
jgi:L-threonylcarbamoyladenylate synthase